jgi:hypothetical protein
VKSGGGDCARIFVMAASPSRYYQFIGGTTLDAASSLMHPRCSGVGLRLISFSLFQSQLNAKIPNSVVLFTIHQN